MSKKTNATTKWKVSTIVVSCLLAAVSTCYGLGVGWKQSVGNDNPSQSQTFGNQSAEEALSLWTKDAEAKEKLVSYMTAVTEEGGADYIPPENRIAVFDLDGTLFCETDPNYFDYTLLVHRVLEDPDYKDKASDFEKETAEKIVTLNETGKAAKGLEVDHGKAIASAFKGMTVGEFNGMTSRSISSAVPTGSSCAALFTILPCMFPTDRSSALTKPLSLPIRAIPTDFRMSMMTMTSWFSAGTSLSKISK